jgi:hypothetical protein
MGTNLKHCASQEDRKKVLSNRLSQYDPQGAFHFFSISFQLFSYFLVYNFQLAMLVQLIALMV